MNTADVIDYLNYLNSKIIEFDKISDYLKNLDKLNSYRNINEIYSDILKNSELIEKIPLNYGVMVRYTN